MAGILRGDIYFADLNPVKGHEQAGVRPVLIISHDILNRSSGTVIALAITSRQQKAGFPLTFLLPDDAGLPKRSWVKINQIRTISVERLKRKAGHMSPDELEPIIQGLMELVG